MESVEGRGGTRKIASSLSGEARDRLLLRRTAGGRESAGYATIESGGPTFLAEAYSYPPSANGTAPTILKGKDGWTDS